MLGKDPDMHLPTHWESSPSICDQVKLSELLAQFYKDSRNKMITLNKLKPYKQSLLHSIIKKNYLKNLFIMNKYRRL